MKLIDADVLIEQMDAEPEGGYYSPHDVISLLMTQPVVEERKTGKWIYSEDEYGIDGYHCDKCGFFVPWDYVHKFINYIDDYNFCPSCGTEMRGDEHETD